MHENCRFDLNVETNLRQSVGSFINPFNETDSMLNLFMSMSWKYTWPEVSKEMLRISCKLFVKVYLLYTDAAVIIRQVLNLATQGVQYHILIYPDIIIEVTYLKSY